MTSVSEQTPQVYDPIGSIALGFFFILTGCLWLFEKLDLIPVFPWFFPVALMTIGGVFIARAWDMSRRRDR